MNSAGKDEFDITHREISLGIRQVIPHELFCQRPWGSPLPERLRAELVARVGQGTPDRVHRLGRRPCAWPHRTSALGEQKPSGWLWLDEGLLTKPVSPRSETLGEQARTVGLGKGLLTARPSPRSETLCLAAQDKRPRRTKREPNPVGRRSPDQAHRLGQRPSANKACTAGLGKGLLTAPTASVRDPRRTKEDLLT